MKQTRLLFIDRDGTLIQEPADEQIDSFEKLVFTKGVFRNLAFIAQHTDYELVMVSNQDGLGTDSFPEDTFWPVHNFIIQTLESEGIHFSKQHIDRHFPEDNSPMRKPGTGMLTEYIDNPAYDMANSYVIGDRETDAQLAENLGCKSLILGKDGMDWDKIAEILFAGDRIAEVKRTTKETDIYIKVNLDGSGKCDISTGLGFFDHMLEQIGKHGMMDLTIHTKGDLYVDEHHTIEDTGIALGECLLQALGDKRGIERYGYSLPMDDCLCQVALDFGGRPWLIWDAEFHREKVGEMPTEMFKHFFKSLILGKDGMDWDKIAEILFAGDRIAEVKRTTKETDIYIKVNLDGSGKCDISTGLGFFDHMLEQIGKHGMMDLTIHTKGDLYVDEHHTIEDTGIALGECLLQALGDKRGIERYGYSLPMDDCLCQVALDFGGRPWLIWDAEFHREKVGEMPTEMFKHFFKSLSDAAKMNLNIKAEGENEHHKIEGIFKALARSLKMAVKRDIYHFELPSSKGML